MTDAPEHPKLFISYSWTTPQHVQWVVELAEKLVFWGVDVKLDKWDLGAGQDAIAFMEGMVNDSTIRKVLMIVDKNYAEKANARRGGVGTETQIISKEIYDKQDQDKFVALFLDRDTKGEPYLPTYYKTRVYIDFSEPQEHEEKTKELLRWIFDKPLYVRPPIGTPPAFLSDKKIINSPTKKINVSATVSLSVVIDAIKENSGDTSWQVAEYLETLSAGMATFSIKQYEGAFDDAVVESITNFMPSHTEFIKLISAIAKHSKGNNYAEVLHKFFEELIPYLYLPKGFSGSYRDTDQDNFRFIIHELFLYTVAILLREEKFEAVHYLISKDYHVESGVRRDGNQMVSYIQFYNVVESIKNRNNRLNLNQISLHTNLLEERAKNLGIDFQHIMQADLVLYMRKEMEFGDLYTRWWPVTLAYTSWSYVGIFKIFAKAESCEYFNKIKPLLNITARDDMIPLFNAYTSNTRRLPMWDFDTLNPKSLINFDKLATKP